MNKSVLFVDHVKFSREYNDDEIIIDDDGTKIAFKVEDIESVISALKSLRKVQK